MTVSAESAIEAFDAATEENKLSSLRREQVVHLGNEGELWMTGDLHDHRRNFEKLLRLADLANNPQRNLVLHEIIHGDYHDSSGGDTSWETLMKAAELKLEFPQQVHFLLGNHDLAQIYGEGIMKAGMSVCEAFNKAIRNSFGGHAASVNVAITEFLLSLPLAVRAPNGIFCSHSIPTSKEIENFDYSVFDRPLVKEDYRRKIGPVYQLIWGRHASAEAGKMFAEKLGANIVISGHQPQENGFLVNGDHHLIVASDHNQGVFIPINLTKTYTMDELLGFVKKFVEVDLD